jgi:hypothetical protein
MNQGKIIFVDAGVSGTKCIVLIDGKVYKFLIEPGVNLLPRSLGDELRVPQHSEVGAGLVEVDGQSWLVGGKPISALSPSAKRESLIPKVLAIVASLIKNSQEFDLVLLLPRSQMATRKILAQELRAAFNGARYEGEPIRAKLREGGLKVIPEGSGLALALGTKRTGVGVMAGHNDLSLVALQNGAVNLQESTSFSGLGAGVIARNAGIQAASDLDIVEAIATNRFSQFKADAPGVREAVKEAIAYHAEMKLKPALSSFDWSRYPYFTLGGGGVDILGPSLRKLIPIPEYKRSFPAEFSRFEDLALVAENLGLGDEARGLFETAILPDEVDDGRW